ncbi:MAG: hypothetical protein ACRC01_10340, partial [Deefgea sp.]
TIGMLGFWLVLSQHGWILLYRYTGESRYPEYRFGWYCRWIPAYAGMTSLMMLMYLTVAIDWQCLEGNTSTLFQTTLSYARSLVSRRARCGEAWQLVALAHPWP